MSNLAYLRQVSFQPSRSIIMTFVRVMMNHAMIWMGGSADTNPEELGNKTTSASETR